MKINNTIKNNKFRFNFMLGIKNIKLTIFSLFLISLSLFTYNKINTIQAGWQRGSFLNGDFRSQNPTNLNITYALYGDGTPSSTAYTKNWNSSCIPDNVIITSTLPNTLEGDTIYVLESNTYTTYSSVIFNGDCIALVGKGNVIIDISNILGLNIDGKKNIIIDNINLSGGSIYGIYQTGSSNFTLNNSQIYNNNLFYGPFHEGCGLSINNSNNNSINNSQIYNSRYGICIKSDKKTNSSILNNLMIFNNSIGVSSHNNSNFSINNSQIFNNEYGITIYGEGAQTLENFNINNSQIYSNIGEGIYFYSYGSLTGSFEANFNDVDIYNNEIGIRFDGLLYTNNINYFGKLRLFENTQYNITGVVTMIPEDNSFRNEGELQLDNQSMGYEWITNPEDKDGNIFITGYNRNTTNRGQKIWTGLISTKTKYGSKILNQTNPVNGSLLQYGINGIEFDTLKYIAQINSTSLTRTGIPEIDKYFGPNSEYSKNRESNYCDMGAIGPIQYLNSSIPSTLNDHTFYIISSGTYNISSEIVLNGDCIGLIATGNVIFDFTQSAGLNSIYANDSKNIIIDGIKIVGNQGYGIKLDGASNNSTISNVISTNNLEGGVFLGTLSKYNTIMNSQFYNNSGYGIFLSYVSSYNLVNNVLSFNNNGYGIGFANGSFRNALNNSQFYNNNIGIFGDLTTSENILNNIHTYNNNNNGFYFKNSSRNFLNNIQSYNNFIGINLDFNSEYNYYFGKIILFDNPGGNITGTNTLIRGINGIESRTDGDIVTNYSIDCNYTTNVFSGINSDSLLNTGNNCNNIGIQNWSVQTNNLNYLFGNQISKQIIPIIYNNNNYVTRLPMQYNATKYIGEVSPIGYTNPGGFLINPIFTGELNTLYSSDSIKILGSINHPVNISLELNPSGSSGSLSISGKNTNGRITSTGFTDVLVPFDLIVNVVSANGLAQTVIGTVNIGTSEYGYSTGEFKVTTKGPNIIPSPFSFLSFSDIDINTKVGSEIIVSGIETGVYASIDFEPNTTSGRIEIYSGVDLIYYGVGPFIVNEGNKIGAYMISSSEYSMNNAGIVTIGGLTGGFTVTTLLDIYPPTISFLSGPTDTSYRTNYFSIDFNGANNYKGYAFISNPRSCNTGQMLSIFNIYTGAVLTNDVSSNNKYICARAKDNGNNISMLSYSKPMKISYMGFEDSVETGPVAVDFIDINYINTYVSKYKFVSTGYECNNNGLSTYNGIFSITDTSLNGLYLCAYGEDGSGSGKTILSNNPVNINRSLPYLEFKDPVSSSWVTGDTIEVNFIGGTFDTKKYKFVNKKSECDNLSSIDYTGAITINTSIYNGKYFCMYASTGSQSVKLVSNTPLKVDYLEPTVPILEYPYNLSKSFFAVFHRSGSIDTDSGISGYNYLISNNSNFSNILFSGFTTGNTLEIKNFNNLTGIYYRKVSAVDVAGNVSKESTVWRFINVNDSDFFLKSIYLAELNTFYTSEKLIIKGLKDGVFITSSISTGFFYKNGSLLPSKTTTLQNNDYVEIRLKSSSGYEDTVTSTLTLSNKSTEFIIKTIRKGEECSLYSGDKEKIRQIFKELKSIYSGSQKSQEFFDTMKSMLEDKLNLTYNCNLQYFLLLINNEINYVAPNCKAYKIIYNSDSDTFSSIHFTKKYNFASLDSIKKYINKNNPGDCNILAYSGNSEVFINSYENKYIAPNGKVYNITSGVNGYSSNTFIIAKIFKNKSDLYLYIDKNNPSKDTRNHTVDTSFTPFTYIAPNRKSYKIYKTNKGYMSYKLLKIQYYQNLSILINYIKTNNQK